MTGNWMRALRDETGGLFGPARHLPEQPRRARAGEVFTGGLHSVLMDRLFALNDEDLFAVVDAPSLVDAVLTMLEVAYGAHGYISTPIPEATGEDEAFVCAFALNLISDRPDLPTVSPGYTDDARLGTFLIPVSLCEQWDMAEVDLISVFPSANLSRFWSRQRRLRWCKRQLVVLAFSHAAVLRQGVNETVAGLRANEQMGYAHGLMVLPFWWETLLADGVPVESAWTMLGLVADARTLSGLQLDGRRLTPIRG